VISWSEQAHGPAIIRTTGMVTFALFAGKTFTKAALRRTAAT
jgi:hypothetical protein